MSIVSQFSAQHHRCDELFTALDARVSANDWHAAQAAYLYFRRVMNTHFATEEQTLFPAFEQAGELNAGPTAIMRAEHDRMRALMDYIGGAVIARDATAYAEQALALRALLTLHSIKEEHILYVLCDEHLAEEQKNLIAGLTDLLQA